MRFLVVWGLGEHEFDAIIPISAQEKDGLEELMAQLEKYAAEGPQLFPDGMSTDQPEKQVVAEIVREKLLRNLDKEVPHGTAIEVTKFSERDSGVIDLDVTIYCEKASHKGIIIGKNGAMLKKIASHAREDIERFMGTKVYMETWVKVKENWRGHVQVNNPGIPLGELGHLDGRPVWDLLVQIPQQLLPDDLRHHLFLHRAVHGDQGLHGDVGEGEGELAG